MTEKLIIFFHDQNTLSWGWVNADGSVKACTDNVMIDDCEELLPIALHKKVIVIIPAMDILLTQVALPKMSKRTLYKAVPYALEDLLISDIETLHFVLGMKQETNWPVAIISKTLLQNWLDLLKKMSIQADEIIPASLAIPWENDTYTVVIKDSMAIVRTNLWMGFACELSNLRHFINASLKNDVNLQQINIYNYTSNSISKNWHNIPAVCEKKLIPNQFIRDMVAFSADIKAINLLQNDFIATKQASKMVRKIMTIGVGISLVWLAFVGFFPFVSAYLLSGYEKSLTKQITAIYNKSFPNAPSLIAPKQRMQSKLNQSTHKTGNERFLLLLAKIGKALSNVPDAKLKRIDYQNNQLNLMLTTASSKDFATFTKILEQNGLQVHQQNATLNDKQVSASLQIE